MLLSAQGKWGGWSRCDAPVAPDFGIGLDLELPALGDFLRSGICGNEYKALQITTSKPLCEREKQQGVALWLNTRRVS